jgi:microsomal epoxide hydrolase
LYQPLPHFSPHRRAIPQPRNSEGIIIIKMADSFAQIPSGALIQPKLFKVSIDDEKVDELKLLIKLSKIAPPTYESTQKEKNFGITHQWLTDAKAAWMKFDWYVDEK